MKPCKQSEIDFYESARDHPRISPYIPDFIGTLSLGDGQSAQAAGAIVLPAETSPELPSAATFGNETVIENKWTPSNGGKIETDLAIVLENVALDFKKPNILDVKLGARLWADDAPEAKRTRLDKAAEETTSKPLGFRIAGMKTYQGLGCESCQGVNLEGYKHFDKNYGRAFSVETVHEGFEDYFLLHRGSKASGGLRKVIRRFVDDLNEMIAAIEEEESRMYSASLLFVYEGDQKALEHAFAKEKDMIASLQSAQELQKDHALDGELDGGVSSPEQRATEESEESDEDARFKFPAIQKVKLIDFAHAQWTPGLGSDENVLRGIRNVAKIMADLAG